MWLFAAVVSGCGAKAHRPKLARVTVCQAGTSISRQLQRSREPAKTTNLLDPGTRQVREAIRDLDDGIAAGVVDCNTTGAEPNSITG